MEGGTNDPDACPPRVLVNALSARVGGGLTYAFEQIRALAELPELSLTVHATDPLAERLERACPGLDVRRHPPRRLARRLLWEQLVLPLLASRFDVLYLPGNFALALSPCPQVVVFQNPHHFGAASRRLRRGIGSWRWRARLRVESTGARVSARRASHVIAVSETLRAGVEEDMGRLDRLSVIRSGVPELPGAGVGDETGFALAVANDYPHKDWDRLIDAFAENPALPPLRIVGACRSPGRERRLQRRLGPLPAGRVSLLGPISDRAALARLYRSAGCVVAHSRLEACPLTPGEARAAGTPLVASDIPAHREVCGARAVYYDPDDSSELARAVERVVNGNGAHGPPPELPSWHECARAAARVLVTASGSRDRR
jgi:glycosyltransferase involved in cell wall biosynthesis